MPYCRLLRFFRKLGLFPLLHRGSYSLLSVANCHSLRRGMIAVCFWLSSAVVGTRDSRARCSFTVVFRALVSLCAPFSAIVLSSFGRPQTTGGWHRVRFLSYLLLDNLRFSSRAIFQDRLSVIWCDVTPLTFLASWWGFGNHDCTGHLLNYREPWSQCACRCPRYFVWLLKKCAQLGSGLTSTGVISRALVSVCAPSSTFVKTSLISSSSSNVAHQGSYRNFYSLRIDSFRTDHRERERERVCSSL